MTTCLNVLLQPDLFSKAVDHRQVWLGLHKLDQDRLLFDFLKAELARQNIRPISEPTYVVDNPAERGPAARRSNFQYIVLGHPVCQHAFKSFWRMGSSRFNSLFRAAVSGAQAPPVDLRYIKRKHGSKEAVARSWVVSYLEELYESEAETMPEHLEDLDALWIEDVVGGSEFYDPASLACLDVAAPPGVRAETRWLPSGSIFEWWQMYNHTFSEHKCSFRYFWHLWNCEFSHKLRFRGVQQHGICAVCCSHKLLIKQLGHDVVRRNKQIQLLDEHRRQQYLDRRVYWAVRANAGLTPTVVCLICDGMDQGKFGYPRHPCVKSKDLESLQRPRLHVNALLCHNQEVLVAVSRADFPKNTNVTLELIAHALTRLQAKGLDLKRAHVHIQLDNTSSCNKNNHLFRWCASAISAGIIKDITVAFLRKGHTHEDSQPLS